MSTIIRRRRKIVKKTLEDLPSKQDNKENEDDHKVLTQTVVTPSKLKQPQQSVISLAPKQNTPAKLRCSLTPLQKRFLLKTPTFKRGISKPHLTKLTLSPLCAVAPVVDNNTPVVKERKTKKSNSSENIPKDVTEEQLKLNYKLVHMKKWCEMNGEKSSGSKSDVINRILKVQQVKMMSIPMTSPALRRVKQSNDVSSEPKETQDVTDTFRTNPFFYDEVM
ncbi:hypothetical protein AKO1_003801 [Acrasis kona]|uniref:SAP domain-containing protein n=1 Tax=Acrasis kona TaxID=1008807 RepID=A0AAW2Z585_9EUKA